MFEMIENGLVGRYFLPAGAELELCGPRLLTCGSETYTVGQLEDRIVYVGPWVRASQCLYLDVSLYLGVEDATYVANEGHECLTVGGSPVFVSLYPVRPFSRSIKRLYE